MKNYYEQPKQVIFYDPDTDSKAFAGIAYGEEIICGECGGTFELNEVVVLKELSWVPIDEEIGGDELFEFRKKAKCLDKIIKNALTNT